MWRAVLLSVLAGVALAACSTAAAQAPLAATSSPSPIPTAAAPASPPSLSAAAAIAPPDDVAVSFSGLHAGSYPVHVHSRCNGGQAFHVITVGTLGIGSNGTGAIAIPRGYVGRGLCAIVYATPSLAAVLTTRPI